MPGSPGPLSLSAKPLILKSFSLLKIRNPAKCKIIFSLSSKVFRLEVCQLEALTCYVSVLSSLLTVMMMMLISCDFNDANDNSNDDNNVALNNDCYEKR